MGHVDIDQHAVVHDLAFGGMNEAHAAHVGGQLIHLVQRAAIQAKAFRQFLPRADRA